MLPFICSQNIDSTSFDITKLILNNTYWTPQIASFLTSFRSDLFFFGFSNLFNSSDLSFLDFKQLYKLLINEF